MHGKLLAVSTFHMQYQMYLLSLRFTNILLHSSKPGGPMNDTECADGGKLVLIPVHCFVSCSLYEPTYIRFVAIDDISSELYRLGRMCYIPMCVRSKNGLRHVNGSSQAWMAGQCVRFDHTHTMGKRME